MAATVALLSDIEALSFGDIVEFYGGGEEDASQEDSAIPVAVNSIDIPDEKLSLYPEEDDESDV